MGFELLVRLKNCPNGNASGPQVNFQASRRLRSFLFLPNFQQLLLFFLVEMAERLQRYVNINHLAPSIDQLEGDRPWDFVADSKTIHTLHGH
jgi:hypothetical protein